MGNYVDQVVECEAPSGGAASPRTDTSAASEPMQTNDAHESRAAELQVVFDHTPTRIWLKDDKNVILRANRAAADSMGIPEEELEGADTYVLFPDMAEKYHRDDLDVIESGSPRLAIVESYAPIGGTQGWVSTDKIPIQLETGQRRLLVMSQDITEHKQRIAKLESLNQSLRDFAAIAAHDLKAPLRQVSMLTDMLEETLRESNTELPAPAAQTIADISSSMTKMLDIVRSLSDLTMLEARPLMLTCENLNEVASEALSQVQMIIADAEATIVVEALPECVIDSELMIQVFQNLILNSCKYRGSEAPLIRIWSQKNIEARSYEVMVEDNGVGLVANQADEIFKPFKRAHRQSEIEGSGLGLTITRRIMAAQGGSIEVDTKYEDGLRMILRLPF